MDGATETRAEMCFTPTALEQRLGELWTRTDRIFGLLAPHAWLAQPIALRHPFIFYVGHLPAFAWNQAGIGGLGRRAFHSAFDELFSRGIDPDVDEPSRCHDHPDVPDRWPALAEVLAYRDRVRGTLLDACARGEATDLIPPDVIEMVVEHELMHQETLLYMMQRLPVADLSRPDWLPAPVIGRCGPAHASGRARIAPGIATLGASPAPGTFGWDNEFPAVEVHVPGFGIDVTPVTIAEFRAFVDDGGYRRAALWDPEGWAWREAAGLDHPIAWERSGGGARAGEWRHRALFDELPLDAIADWPVYASLAEARAFARWQGRRLPTEAEYHRAAYGDPGGPDRPHPWGAAAPAARHGNFHFQQWAPMPVGSHPDGQSAWAVHDLVGDGWEWTDTAFAPFPGFAASPRYPGYSADFFDDKHAVLKGGSWATDAALLRPSFRNWFQAHYPYVFAKFRCAS